ncbi:TPA: hypothetical protein SEY12_000405 [Campylobacter jejuni]|nr:hypothetical protein [Campylobacter jejuni]HEG5223651.1 hypothetical protein [Campylobacter jejuni]HEG5338722.1 hypothetical protein [Campylobacter jejuni]
MRSKGTDWALAFLLQTLCVFVTHRTRCERYALEVTLGRTCSPDESKLK